MGAGLLKEDYGMGGFGDSGVPGSNDLSGYTNTNEVDFDNVLNVIVSALTVGKWLDQLLSVDTNPDDKIAYFYFDPNLSAKEFDQLIKKLKSCWKYVEYAATPADYYQDEEGNPGDPVGAHVVRVSLTKVNAETPPGKDDYDIENDFVSDKNSDSVLGKALRLVLKGVDPAEAVKTVTKAEGE